MKLRWQNQIRGMTLTEVLVVIGSILILAAIILPALAAAKRKTSHLTCVSNLNQIGLAMKVWSGDNYEKFPMAFCVTNKTAMQSLASGRAYILWQMCSNEIISTKILCCPKTPNYFSVNGTWKQSDEYISYFLNLDASEIYPQMILSGDDNLLVNDKPVSTGILNLKNSDLLAWQDNRHKRVGNILMADGSVQQLTIQGLQNASANSFADTNSPSTNRLVIP